MRRLIWGAIASALLLSLTPSGAGALLALGGEFQVNTYIGKPFLFCAPSAKSVLP